MEGEDAAALRGGAGLWSVDGAEWQWSVAVADGAAGGHEQQGVCKGGGGEREGVRAQAAGARCAGTLPELEVQVREVQQGEGEVEGEGEGGEVSEEGVEEQQAAKRRRCGAMEALGKKVSYTMRVDWH